VLIDQSASRASNGTPQQPHPYGVLVAPARADNGAKPVSMVVGGFAVEVEGAGVYGVYQSAQAEVQRTQRPDSAGRTTVEEHWKFGQNDGTSLEIRLKFAREALARTHMDLSVNSGRLPAFHRTCRVDHWSEIVKSETGHVNHAQELTFRAQGTGVSRFFAGDEKPIAVSSIPIYLREMYVDPALPRLA